MAVEMAPPILSLSSDENDDVAFKVLNNDNLPTIAVIGEPIFKPFGQDQKIKPNLIVHPTRRVVTNLEDNKQKSLSKSHGYINNVEHTKNNINNKNLRKKFSNSHGHLNHHNSSAKIKIEDFKNQIDTRFTKTLDAKLRKLQREANKKNVKNIGSIPEKPRFVTTVKRGTFEEPPIEKAYCINYKIDNKQEREKLYAYASRPRILCRSKRETKFDTKKDEALKLEVLKDPRVLTRSPAKDVHMQRCQAAFMAAKIAGGVAGIFKQIQEDKENFVNDKFGVLIYHKRNREMTYANVMYDKRVFRGSNFAATHMGDGESAAARAAEARRRALARKKAKQGSKNLRLGSPPAVPGRRHENIQTETYLEELYVNPPTNEVCTQTDLFLERPVSPFYVPAKTGADVGTQIYPGDLFDFDMEVQPILEVLVGKTVEQALIEVLEEEELAALREQQRKFLEMSAAEAAEALRLEEREKRLVKEKERRIKEHEEGVKLQKEMEERIAAAVLMQGYMADLLPSVLEGLESEGFMVDSIKEDIDETFMPWLIKEVTHELQDMVCSRDVLSDIVREILENRAEIYKALNKETPSEETEEEGPSMEDLLLQDHIKLQQEIQRQEMELREQAEKNK